MRTLKTSGHDIAGNSFFRTFRLNVLNKMIPLGDYRFGIGLRPALVLLVLHYFSRPVFHLLIRYEPQFHRLYQIMKKRR
jgi:hypothetical protein